MKLFGYYAWHTVVNQFRKLFKTWVLVLILVCGLVGGIVGMGAATLEEAANPIEEETEVIAPEIIEETEISFEDISGISAPAAVELGAGAVILAMCVIQIFSADRNGSKIFLPADVNLLFASPMHPQSVLMFRVATQAGAALLGTLYLLFQLPNLVINLHMDLWSALALIVAWSLTIVFSRLLQTLIYTYSSTYTGAKKYLRSGTYAVLAAAAAGYSIYTVTSGKSWLISADAFFNAGASRWIPVWGWLKGFCRFAMEGKAGPALGMLALTFAAFFLIGITIYRIKADFYEDAMAKSQEVAEMMDKVNSDSSGRLVFSLGKKKERAESIRNDTLDRGWGASVFFWKTLHSRFRFGHLHYFTKTSETYLVTAALIGIFLRMVVRSDSVLPILLAIGVFVFFRTLGNPLAEDIRSQYFRMIPESTGAKLFWSLLSGTVNCFLDIAPAVLLGTVITGGSFLQALAGIPVILSVDFYATCISSFLEVSIPESIGKTIRQVIQIMFIYFGLLPDIAVIAIGIAFKHPFLGLSAAALVNAALGFVFFGLSLIYLEPQGGKHAVRPADPDQTSAAKKVFSKTGFALCFMLVLTAILQTAISFFLVGRYPNLTDNEIAVWLMTFIPMYLAAVPLALLLLRRIPASAPPQRSLKKKYLWILPAICLFMMYAGNICGTLITTFFASLKPAEEVSPMALDLINGSLPMRLLFVVILAPCIEEYVFRKQLIDRFRVFDEKQAVVLSALMFGLFHGNFSQFFYTVGLGLVWGYVYLKTGKLRYTIAMHMFVNFTGGIIGPELAMRVATSLPSLQEMAQMDASEILTPAILVFAGYTVLLLSLALLGLVLFATENAHARFLTAERQIPVKGRIKTSWLNPGMILFVIACGTLFLFTII